MARHDERFEIRASGQDVKEWRLKAGRRGLSAVVRALLRSWYQSTQPLDPEVLAELAEAQYQLRMAGQNLNTLLLRVETGTVPAPDELRDVALYVNEKALALAAVITPLLPGGRRRRRRKA